jgi:hypothetical protein
MLPLFNLASGRELIWVLGQVVWAIILGMFYGVVVLKSNGLASDAGSLLGQPIHRVTYSVPADVCICSDPSHLWGYLFIWTCTNNADDSVGDLVHQTLAVFGVREIKKTLERTI